MSDTSTVRRSTRLAATLLLAGGLLVMGAGVALAAGVSMVDNDFSPSQITVAPGEAVTFTNDGDSPHTATADDGSFDTGSVDPGSAATVTFDTPGSYPFHCEFHGSAGGIGMSGTIVVTGGGGGDAGDGGRGAGTGGGVAGGVSGTTLPQTASPLPFIGGAGILLLAFGLWLGRRRLAR